MFWTCIIIAAVAIGFLVGFFAEYDGWFDWYAIGSSIAGGFCGFIAASVIGLIGSAAVSDFNIAVTTSKPDVRSWNLVSMADGSTKTSGSFFLGTGMINQTNMYIFYIDYGNRFQQTSVETYGVDIVYTDQQPVFSEYGHFESENSFWTWFANEKEWKVDRREFKIPAGSIKQDYTLDSQ